MFDEERRNSHIWVGSQHPGERLFYAPTTWEQLPVYGPDTGDRQILHILEQRRFDQPRGVPLLATVLRNLRQSDEGIANELTASLVQSLFTVFVKTQLGDEFDDQEIIQSLGNGDGRHYGPPPDKQELRLGRGAVARLEPGEDITLAGTNRPNINLTAFLGEVLAHTGAGVGMPPELILKRFQTSYTAAQAAMQEAYRAFDRRQTWAVETGVGPIYEMFVDECVLRGYVDAPGFHDDPLMRAAWLRVEFRGPSKTQLDELKAVLAAERRVAAGFSTIEHETTALTGLDADQVHEVRVRETQRRVTDGLEVPATATALPNKPTRPRDMMRPDDTGREDDEGGSDDDREAVPERERTDGRLARRRPRIAASRTAKPKPRAKRSLADAAIDHLIQGTLLDATR